MANFKSNLQISSFHRWTASSNGGSSPNVTPAPSGRPTSSSQSSDKLNGRSLRLVFDETFDSSSVDTSKWTYDVSMWGGGVRCSWTSEASWNNTDSSCFMFHLFCLQNNEFQTYTPHKQNTYIKDGKLYIKPVKSSASHPIIYWRAIRVESL